MTQLFSLSIEVNHAFKVIDPIIYQDYQRFKLRESTLQKRIINWENKRSKSFISFHSKKIERIEKVIQKSYQELEFLYNDPTIIKAKNHVKNGYGQLIIATEPYNTDSAHTDHYIFFPKIYSKFCRLELESNDIEKIVDDVALIKPNKIKERYQKTLNL